MPQTLTRAKRSSAPKSIDQAIAELKKLLDLPPGKRAPSWGERVRKLHDFIKK